MRDDDSPAGAREAGLRRLGRLTWRTTQLGAMATVGFAIVFARTAPSPAANVQSTTPPESAKATAVPSVTPTHPTSKPRRAASSPPATRSAAQQATPSAARPTAPPAARSAAPPPAPPPAPSLAPPTTAPAPAPSSASPVPTVTSASHGGG